MNCEHRSRSKVLGDPSWKCDVCSTINPQAYAVPELAVTINGAPKGWALRTTRRGRNYTPEAQRDWGATATEILRLAWGGRAPLTGPCALDVFAVMPRPGRLTKWLKKQKRWRDDPGRAACVAKPDCTNVQKLVEDAITRAGVWTDDAVVVATACAKVYAAIGEAPGVHVRVRVA